MVSGSGALGGREWSPRDGIRARSCFPLRLLPGEDTRRPEMGIRERASWD